MKVHEYQARQLLSEAGIEVPPAELVETAEQAESAYEKLTSQGAAFCVVKAQVHAGGRGKGGGVRLVRSAQEARQAAGEILSRPLVTAQTGPEGVKVRKLLVAAAVEIRKEFYLGMTIDRAANRPVMIISAQGGVEIEQVARTCPQAIYRLPVHPLAGLADHQARRAAFALGLTGKQVGQAVRIMRALADLFVRCDASLLEINPLVLTAPQPEHPDGRLVAIDAKCNFDDNALFRQPRAQQFFDPDQEDPAELEAKQHGLSYIKLEGNIGCLVNGAGLAMSTMDIIKLHGGEPANFLDVGGSASEQAVTQAFAIILQDPNVRGVLVNIFGGIMPCDRIARAIVAAAEQVGFTVPLVVRLEGTNVDQARRILQQARDKIPVLQTADDLADAAAKVCAAVV